MTKDLKHLNAAALTNALQPWVDARKDDVTIVGKALGTALANMPHTYGLEGMDFRELLNAYVATTIGKLVPKIEALHARLVEVAGAGVEYDFGYADRYAMVFADTPSVNYRLPGAQRAEVAASPASARTARWATE